MKNRILFILVLLGVCNLVYSEVYIINRLVGNPTPEYKDFSSFIIHNWLNIDQREYRGIVSAFPNLTTLYGKGTLTDRYEVWIQSFHQKIEDKYGEEALKEYVENFDKHRLQVLEYLNETFDPNITEVMIYDNKYSN